MSKNSTGQEIQTRAGVDARLTRNWQLMVGVTIASTVGMAVAVAPVLGQQFGTIWPWPNTHLVLLGGLAISVVLLVAHLTSQQRKLSDIHGEVQWLDGASHHLEEKSLRTERQSQARPELAAPDPPRKLRQLPYGLGERARCQKYEQKTRWHQTLLLGRYRSSRQRYFSRILRRYFRPGSTFRDRLLRRDVLTRLVPLQLHIHSINENAA